MLGPLLLFTSKLFKLTAIPSKHADDTSLNLIS